MAQLVLGIGGAAAGNALLPGGLNLLGASVSGAAMGGFAGTLLGGGLDRALLGGNRTHGPRLPELHVQTSTEGAPIPLVFGRARIAGQVIWAARLTEHADKTSMGGKGGGPTRVDYRYSVSFAVGLCEGEITGIGRIWANGTPLEVSGVNYRLYRGGKDQLPDALIEAVEGSGYAPAFRGLAYAVFEDLPLDDFGGRIPNLSFEVFRPAQAEDGEPGLERLIKGVDLIPASGEFSYATEAVVREIGPGRDMAENVNNSRGLPDLTAALDDLQAQLPECRSILLVSAWFGNDLRCGHCQIRPGVETRDKVTHPLVWAVAGEDRTTAWLVTQADGRPVYGGTPSDGTLIAAMQDIRARGLSVSLYPFILMDVPGGNGLPDPWGGAEQAAFPWRGRITCHPAPGVAGSADQTSAADDQVTAFFGAAAAADFSVSGTAISYGGPAEWSFRRFILHHAALARAGGADGFLIGSEMRGLTQVRGVSGFPSVAELCDLAAEVRSLLGADVRLSYAADWSEYFGYHPADGSGDVWFHLDPLWSHPAIDAVAIDWYAPASDWREGSAHLDAQLWPSIHDPVYLESNVEGGEGYDWYYASEADRDTQLRTPITDGGAGKPWVFRYKDLSNWWGQLHHDRPGGIESGSATGWVPQSKPIWITEVGCPAVDKGANQPHVFVDPKSSESTLPHSSDGRRDDLIQRRYLEAFHRYWDPEAGHNPVSSVYGGPMLDPDLIHVWTWDARPFPDFPAREEIWSDGGNWWLGHWLTGRAGLAPLSGVVADIGARCDLELDASTLDGLVSGFVLSGPVTGRSALEPLALAYGFAVREHADGVALLGSNAGGEVTLPEAMLVLPDHGDALTRQRMPAGFLPSNVRLRFIGDWLDYEPQSLLAHSGAQAGGEIADHAWPLLADEEQASDWAQGVLNDAIAAGEQLSFELPPSLMALEPGDRFHLDSQNGAVFRIESASGGETRRVLARRHHPRTGAHRGSQAGVSGAISGRSRPALAVLDIALLAEESSDRDGVLLAASVSPWPGSLAIHAGPDAAALEHRLDVTRRTPFGTCLNSLVPGCAGRWQAAGSLHVRLNSDGLSSSDRQAVLNGANRIAVEHDDGWLVLHFLTAELIGDGAYSLTGLLHNDLAAPMLIGAEARLIVLDTLPDTLSVPAHERGEDLTLRAGDPRLSLQSPFQTSAAFTYQGRDLAPLSPVHLKWDRVAEGYRFRWIRRSRIGGEDWSAPVTPLGEAREAYRVGLFDGGTLLDEGEVTAPEFVLSGSDAATLYAGGGGAPVFSVAQASDRFGPGAAAFVNFTL
ncbi:baseplate multidomain protein megatron [Hyphobacterium marinum]|uniref:Glycoside hydrolase/phage tail family protein n=1 Tax=Hyphobacterium marinum TaxID=3116574 RepID=A0ABU7M0K6_9PROT|nr:glycoside hydrolase/phage tail family protein [Hyphobacterium sp. Y6023]MEE2567321.1 glycoside hydrolase/phage tail family protein [Hyphobacterium sp. Y6023]